MRPDGLRVSAFEIPTSTPESDGTLSWTSTVLVTVELRAGDQTGFGYTYADVATAQCTVAHLAPIVLSHEAGAVAPLFDAMERAVRNVGRDGIAATAIAAVDMAAWDLRARLHGESLVDHLGARRREIAGYGSGGFTSYTVDELSSQLADWQRAGYARVKMKIGAADAASCDRVSAARRAIGDDVELFVDANGTYDAKTALRVAGAIARFGVTWFEEPVSSDDLDGLRFVRERAPAVMKIAAGEYGYRGRTFERMLEAGAVDVLQADATRCGVTGFLAAARSCAARGVELSAHCAPAVHAHVGCAAPNVVHVEVFHDHERIERTLFEGAPIARGGRLRPDAGRPGLGIALRRAEAARSMVFDAQLGRSAA